MPGRLLAGANDSHSAMGVSQTANGSGCHSGGANGGEGCAVQQGTDLPGDSVEQDDDTLDRGKVSGRIPRYDAKEFHGRARIAMNPSRHADERPFGQWKPGAQWDIYRVQGGRHQRRLRCINERGPRQCRTRFNLFGRYNSHCAIIRMNNLYGIADH
jgi:hypothetical protein